MTVSLNSIFPFLPLVIVLFHKSILRRLGFNPERARDKFGILSAALFILIATYVGAQSSLSRHVTYFFAGVGVAIPARVLSKKHTFKNIKDNVLYSRESFAFYLSLIAGAVLGCAAGYLGLLREFVSFGGGWATASLAFLVFYIVRYEKKLGPLMLN